MKNKLIKLGFLGALSVFSTVSYALPFSIVPKNSLPTEVVEGQTAIALYTVTNNTAKDIADNFVKYLPPNVEQVTFDPSIPDLCEERFALEANDGTPGRKISCTLELKVSGPVDANDPNPHQHLFVCFPGGLTCAGTESPLNVSEISCPLPAKALVAVGAFSTIGLPIPVSAIVVSTDQLTQATLKTLVSETDTSLQDVSCSCNRCVAVGSSGGFPELTFPVVAVSSDPRTNWTQTILGAATLPQGFDEGRFRGVSCLGNQCVVAGTYTKGTGEAAVDIPGVARSTDGGATWQQQALPLPKGTINGRFSDVSCIGHQCIAVGSYRTPTLDAFPGVAISTDNGQTWSARVLTLPKPFIEGFLNSISCTGYNCVAVGGYLHPDFDGFQRAIAVTNDGGITWDQQVLPSLGEFFEDIFVSVSCTGSFCMAVAPNDEVFSSKQDFFFGSSAVSYNGGASWTTRILEDLTPTTVYCSNAVFNNFCVLVSEDDDVATSLNGGKWFTKTPILNPPLQRFEDLELNAITGTAGT